MNAELALPSTQVKPYGEIGYTDKLCRKCHHTTRNCICDILQRISKGETLSAHPLSEMGRDYWQDPKTGRWREVETDRSKCWRRKRLKPQTDLIRKIEEHDIAEAETLLDHVDRAMGKYYNEHYRWPLTLLVQREMLVSLLRFGNLARAPFEPPFTVETLLYRGMEIRPSNIPTRLGFALLGTLVREAREEK